MTVAPFTQKNPVADVLILNGPGTCCTLALAAYVNKVCHHTLFTEALSSPKTSSLV